MKELDKLKLDFFLWSNSELTATSQEEAIEHIERIRGLMEENINILAEDLVKKAKAVFPEEDNSHYQIKIDED